MAVTFDAKLTFPAGISRVPVLTSETVTTQLRRLPTSTESLGHHITVAEARGLT